MFFKISFQDSLLASRTLSKLVTGVTLGQQMLADARDFCDLRGAEGKYEMGYCHSKLSNSNWDAREGRVRYLSTVVTSF